jgi:hypothetical protein
LSRRIESRLRIRAAQCRAFAKGDGIGNCTYGVFGSWPGGT